MQLTDAHRKMLSELMYQAFLEVRMLGSTGKSEQAADLADAFHNLPKGMWEQDFSLEFFRDSFLKTYQDKYPEGRPYNYVAVVDEMLSQGEDYRTN